MEPLAYTHRVSKKGVQRKLKRRIKTGMWLMSLFVFIILGLGVFNYYLIQQVSASEMKINRTIGQYEEILQKHDILLKKHEEMQVAQEMSSQVFAQEKASLLQEQEKLLEEIRILKEQSKAKSDGKAGAKGNGKVAYLTFDDGPSANTKSILDTLKEHGIPATFFVIGKGLEQADTKALYQRIVDEGHELANHTYTHQYSYLYASSKNFFQDFNRLEKEVFDLTNKKMTMVRFPGGSNTQLYKKYNKSGVNVMTEIKEELGRRGYVYVDWNVDSQDAKTSELRSKQAIIETVVRDASQQKTAVILMHDAPAKKTTAEALPEIIRQLKEKGYEFKALTLDSTKVQF